MVILGLMNNLSSDFNFKILFDLFVCLTPLLIKFSIGISKRFENFIMFEVLADEKKITAEELYFLQKKIVFIY